jgi:hypothetical protein
MLTDTNRTRIASLVAILVPAVGILTALFLIPWEQSEDWLQMRTAAFLFLGVLPLVNALFDTLSYGITIALTQRGRRGLALPWAIVDGVVALMLFLALGATLVVVAAGMERIAGVPFVDLGTLLTQDFDLGTYWWLYAMLFSTAVPTLFHLVIAALSLQTVLPRGLRSRLCAVIERAHAGAAVDGVVATLLIGLLFATGIALPLGLLWLLGWAFWSHGLGHFLYWYQDLLVGLYVWILGAAG